MPRPNAIRGFAAAIVAVGIGAAVLGATDEKPRGPSHGDPALGKKIYSVKCVACHKPDGTGGIKVTGNPTPNWRNAKRMADTTYNDDYLRDCITNGKPKSGMVAWPSQGLKTADIENLIAYIRTFSAPKKKK